LDRGGVNGIIDFAGLEINVKSVSREWIKAVSRETLPSEPFHSTSTSGCWRWGRTFPLRTQSQSLQWVRPRECPAPCPVAGPPMGSSREGCEHSRPELSRRASNEFGARALTPGTGSGWRRWGLHPLHHPETLTSGWRRRGPRTQRSSPCERARAG